MFRFLCAAIIVLSVVVATSVASACPPVAVQSTVIQSHAAVVQSAPVVVQSAPVYSQAVVVPQAVHVQQFAVPAQVQVQAACVHNCGVAVQSAAVVRQRAFFRPARVRSFSLQRTVVR